MSTIRIPNQGKFNQPNKGEIFGNVYRTTNIDFKTNPGILRLSPRLTLNVKDNDSGITGLGIATAFVVHTKASTAQIYAACGIGTGVTTAGTGKILVAAGTDPAGVFANDGTASTPTNIQADHGDMVEWRKNLIVNTTGSSGTSDLALLLGSWTVNWFTSTLSGSFATNGSPKNMCAGFNGNLYICDDYKVIYVSTTPTAVTSGAGTVNSQNVYRPIWIRSSSNRLWIGLMTMDTAEGTVGYVAEWDGTGTAFTKIYKIDAPCALSCVIKNDIPYIIDAYGILKKFNGSGFTEVARLPVANLNIEMPGIYNDLTNNRWIHHRGMDLVDGKINIVVNNYVSTGVYVKEMPSGVWELNDTDPSNVYLYHKNSPCYSSTDWGQLAIPVKGAGAIMGTKQDTANYICGFSYYTDNASTQRFGLFYDEVATNTNKRGIMETPFITSSKIEDVYQDLTYRFKPFTSGDHIVSKWRTMKDAHMPFIASATWTSTTTFTSTDSNFQYVSAGNEVEIVMGTGASSTAHVSSISVNAGTYTITIDTAIGASSGSGKVMMTNYKLLINISDTGISSETTNVGDNDTKIQIKTEYRGTGDFEVDDMTLNTKTHQ